MKKRLEDIAASLKKRYKIVVLENDTFLEKLAAKAPLWYFVSWFFAGLLVLVFLVSLLIKFTPVREYLIGDDDFGGRKELIEAYSRIDSLSQKVSANDLYLNNLKNVLGGTMVEIDEEVPEINNEQTKISSERGISSYAFHSPVRGIVTGNYDMDTRHFATDIATKLNEPIKSTLDGHVIFASYTPSTGHVIIVQHLDNLVSVYKHCAVLLKKAGSFVRGGEVIAMVGNTGELSTGPHLHFELWNFGNPVNPENYITF